MLRWIVGEWVVIMEAGWNWLTIVPSVGFWRQFVLRYCSVTIIEIVMQNVSVSGILFIGRHVASCTVCECATRDHGFESRSRRGSVDVLMGCTVYVVALGWSEPHMENYVLSETVIGIATRYELDGPGIESRWESVFSHPSRPSLWPTQFPAQRVPGLFVRGKSAGAWCWPSTSI
jgi:hypothetical protein